MTTLSRYELNDVKAAARGHWPAILNRVAAIDDDFLDVGRHGPCPKCGGDDRWNFTNLNEDGGAICNQCDKFGDGFAVIQWMCGIGFIEALKRVGEFLGVQPVARKRHSKNKQVDPFRNIEFQDLSEPSVNKIMAVWCLKKRVKPDSVRSLNPRIARYRKRYTVIAIPVHGKQVDDIIGWTLYEAFGGNLPLYNPKTKETDWLKVKTLKLKD
jgi:hypothetical protein